MFSRSAFYLSTPLTAQVRFVEAVVNEVVVLAVSLSWAQYSCAWWPHRWCRSCPSSWPWWPLWVSATLSTFSVTSLRLGDIFFSCLGRLTCPNWSLVLLQLLVVKYKNQYIKCRIIKYIGLELWAPGYWGPLGVTLVTSVVLVGVGARGWGS